MAFDPRTSARQTETAGDVPSRPADLSYIERILEAAGRSAHYAVVSFVGQGGLGAVYKAIDTRLKRPVALKVLRGAKLLDARAAARLRAEALAAASLDHPYICKMYELIEAGNESLIVMEFLDGETLARVRRRGALPLAATVRIGLEIAEGLAAAHAQGLVHRDVTPGNVMITPHGHVKLLDFGLALQDSLAESAAETYASPHVSDPRAGTPHYMSPEQAAGKSVTARADLFSLGVILFECLTGRLPFRGRGSLEYVQHLQSDPPERLDRLAPDTPAELARLVAQCLEKSPTARPESAAAIVTALRGVLAAFSGAENVAPTIGVERRRARWRTVAAVLFGAVCVLLAWLVFYRTPAPPVWTSRSFASSSAAESGSRMSPDGRWLSYLSTVGGATELKVQRIDGGDAQAVELPAGAVLSQVWSPDGNQIASVIRQDGIARLAVVPAFFGGKPVPTVVVTEEPGTVRLLRWIGRTIYFQLSDNKGRSLRSIDLDRGAVDAVSTRWKVPGNLNEVDVSPDGRRVAFTTGLSGREDLWTGNVDGTAITRITDDAFVERFPMWSGRGDSVIFQSNRGGQLDLWQTRPGSSATSPLTSSPTAEIPDDTSADGRFVSLTQTAESGHLWLWNGATARQLTDDALRDSSPSAALSGGRMVFQRTRASGLGGNPIADSQLFVGVLSPAGELTAPRAVADGFAPSISPDGQRLAYAKASADSRRVALIVRDLRNDQETVVSQDAFPPSYGVFPTDWAEPQMAWDRSASVLYFIERQDAWVLRRFRVGEATADPPLAQARPGQVLHGVSVSHDGRQVAFLSGQRQESQPTLHLLNVVNGATHEVALTSPTRPFIRGWLASGAGVVIVRQNVVYEDSTSDLDVLVVTPAGAVRTAARLDRAFSATARLDARRELLYTTRVEAGVHNVYAVPLAGAGVRRLTDNTLPGVTFSGIEPLSDGHWIGVRAQRTSDIWLMETASP